MVVSEAPIDLQIETIVPRDLYTRHCTAVHYSGRERERDSESERLRGERGEKMSLLVR